MRRAQDPNVQFSERNLIASSTILMSKLELFGKPCEKIPRKSPDNRLVWKSDFRFLPSFLVIDR